MTDTKIEIYFLGETRTFELVARHPDGSLVIGQSERRDTELEALSALEEALRPLAKLLAPLVDAEMRREELERRAANIADPTQCNRKRWGWGWPCTCETPGILCGAPLVEVDG